MQKRRFFIMTILIFFVFLLSGCGKQNQASNVSGQATETSASTLEPYLVGEKLLQFLPDEKLKRLPDVLPRAFRAIISVDGLTEEILLVDTQELDYAVNLLAKINVEECVSVPAVNSNHSFTLIWQDGTSSFIPLNGRKLEATVKGKSRLFRLQGIDELWLYLESYVEKEE